jgi:hypothetical protein
MTLPLQGVRDMDSIQNNFDTVSMTFPINPQDISSNAVTTDKILDANVTTAKIADANVTAAKLAAAIGNFGAWTAYTPAWTSTTATALGTGGVASGYYAQIGKVVHVRFKIQLGSAAVTFGSGQYFVSLPVTAAATGTASGVVGVGYGFDSSASAMSSCLSYLASTTKVGFYYNTTLNGAFNTFGATLPWTWAINDEWEGSFVYQAA